MSTATAEVDTHSEALEGVLAAVIQPEEAVEADVEQNDEQEIKSKEVSRKFASMDLTLTGDADPNQLTGAQYAALGAVMNFDLREVGAWPHVVAFMHLCVKRGLDPFMGETFLIARGTGKNRKFTTQTGIDGYRILAARTGKLIGVKNRVWTGSDDGDHTWRFDPSTGIMRRVWFDQWPASRGFPGAGRVTVVHYDDRGAVVDSDFAADWDMYVPLYDEYEGTYPNGRKTGNKIPGEMWQKGGPHMILKCAEAGGLRMAIPGGVNGLYIHEEMQKADQIEADRMKAEKRAALSKSFAAATREIPAAKAQPAAAAPEPEEHQEPGEAPAGPPLNLRDDIEDADVVDEQEQAAPEAPEAPQEPAAAPEAAPEPQPVPEDQAGEQDAPAAPDVVPERPAAQDPTDRLNHLRVEVDFIARLLGKPKEELLARKMAFAQVDAVGKLSAEALAEFVIPMRQVAQARLRNIGRAEEAETYSRVAPGEVGPLAWLGISEG